MSSTDIKSNKHVELYRVRREMLAIRKQNNDFLEILDEKDEQIAWLECELIKQASFYENEIARLRCH